MQADVFTGRAFSDMALLTPNDPQTATVDDRFGDDHLSILRGIDELVTADQDHRIDDADGTRL